MLHELHISDLGVFADADLAFDAGLTVLTGETGAGKTMVTTGLGLALGVRARAQLVRPGAAAARVQARFDAPDPVEGDVADWVEDGQLILARRMGADGKGGARIGGQLATASALASLGRRLVEIHGQHESLRLLEPATQTALLDRCAGAEHLRAVERCRAAAAALVEAVRDHDALTVATREREREIDLLAYQVREIEGVVPQPGETSRVELEAGRLEHVARLQDLATGAQAAMTDDGAAADALASVAAAIETAATLDPGVGELAARARGLAADAVELGRDVRAYGESLAAEPDRLDEVRQRLAALKGLQRKYGADDDEVLAFHRDAAERLARLHGADERLAELAAEVERRRDRLSTAAAEVSAGRAAAAPGLEAALTAEIAELGMPTAAVQVALHPIEPLAAGGAERVELLVTSGTGSPPLPIATGASGGELSRIMLACRSVVADLDEVPTVVFDEIDAGIGGQAGLAVGRRLALLARDRQVIAVTHLPQIACFADRHVRIRKDEGTAVLEPLDGEERTRELSRMLAGLEASTHAASHAEELLAEAARIREAASA